MSSSSNPTIGLVSMPWMAMSIPSIQLATLAAALRQEQIDCVSHELFLDYAARIGPNLYNILSNAGGFIEEWLFARHYYRAEIGDNLASFRLHRPRFGLDSVEMEDQCLDALESATDEFLEEVAEWPDWSGHDIIGFSLTISQTAASMALARLLKRRFRNLLIIWGGSACAGPMGRALLKVCPYVDIVVAVEGEVILPEIARRLRNGRALDGLPGVLQRGSSGDIIGSPAGPILTKRVTEIDLHFDEYFDRLHTLGLNDRIEPWLPFESSRGCWWGEKNQCTFCGLHEIMKYRNWSFKSVLAQLERLYERYQIPRFFAVDLIMPKEYLKTLLPEIVNRGHSWSLFYEIKANLKRSDVEILAASGVRWIQPGIESLDDSMLRLMNKGVTALQNIQLLKWCRELGIQVTWNVITDLPGENPEAYTSMAKIIPSLFHLPPPSGASPFALHRFSPYFENPQLYGITRLGAHPLYQYIFPVEQNILDDLVYLHDYSVVSAPSPETYLPPVYKAIAEWRAAYDRGASLEFHELPAGGGKILDCRALPKKHYDLTQSEALLYQFLDPAKPERTLNPAFVETYREEANDLQSTGGIAARLDMWNDQRLVLRHSGQVFALAIPKPQLVTERPVRTSNLQAPVPYLSDHRPQW